MIVVDTNILVFLYLPTEWTRMAENLLVKNPCWAVPILWRSEFRSVLALCLRKGLLSLEEAMKVQAEAESLLAETEYESNSADVLRLVTNSNCSAYDCEFVALAQALGVKLVTEDRKILREFPDLAVSLNGLQ